MGFLADVGRANVLGQVMQYGQFVRQGEALRQNEALTNQKLQRGAIDIQQKQAEYEELHRKRPAESSIIFQMTPEEQRPALLEVMKKGGYVDENGTMSAFNKNQMLNESAEFWKFYIPIQQQQAQMAVDKSLPAMLKAQSSGDAEAFEKAKNQYMQDIGKLAAAKGAIGELAKLIPGLGGDEKAPTVKEFDEGNEKVTRQWNPDTKKWDEVARGPRYKPGDTTGGEKRAKDSELRQILKESYGLSDFIVTAADQQVRQKFTVALAFAAEIARNPEGFGLAKDAGAGEIAKKAKEMEQSSSGEEVPTPVPIERFDPRKR